MKTRIAKLLVVVLLLIGLTGCTSSFSSIDKNVDGTYTMTRNVRAGFLFGGPKAQVWTGRYDAATNTMTIIEKSELGPE